MKNDSDQIQSDYNQPIIQSVFHDIIIIFNVNCIKLSLLFIYIF